MLVRSCLEAVGTLARALQGGLTSNGRLLRAVLLPVLERLSDPCASVASSAAAAISSLCFHGGYATFGQLVAANADYIVDGLCKQLRRLSDHPMSVPFCVMLACDTNAAPSCNMREGWATRIHLQEDTLVDGHACLWLHSSASPCTDTCCHQQTGLVHKSSGAEHWQRSDWVLVGVPAGRPTCSPRSCRRPMWPPTCCPCWQSQCSQPSMASQFSTAAASPTWLWHSCRSALLGA